MNVEEHCDVFVTSEGRGRQGDCDVLSKCLLQARQKNRLAEGMSKITVDSPITYLLSDLLNILQNEMGKLDKATSSAPFMRITGTIAEMRAEPRSNFMFSGMLDPDPMATSIVTVRSAEGRVGKES